MVFDNRNEVTYSGPKAIGAEYGHKFLRLSTADERFHHQLSDVSK